MAPEMLTPDTELYDHKIDNWALGVLLYEMLVSALPFYGDDEEELEQQILRGALNIPGYISKEATDLISGLLERVPEKRVNLVDIPNHPWMVKNLAVKSLKTICIKFIQDSHHYYKYDLSCLSEKLRSELHFDAVHPRFFSE